MGYYPSKIACLLNIVIMLGYGMIDCLVGGQVLSAVAGGRLTVAVGIVIIAVLTWIVVIFGMGLFHIYERYLCSGQISLRLLGILTCAVDGLGSLSL
jgi:purine-cytosine permease-like protein